MLTVCGIETHHHVIFVEFFIKVATAPTARGMRRRVRGSRGTKWRWGPHISSPWLKGRENKGDKVIVLTACGIETHFEFGKDQSQYLKLQQHLALAVCDEGCEVAEERSDDEVRISLVSDRREGKTIEWKYLPLAVLKRYISSLE